MQNCARTFCVLCVLWLVAKMPVCEKSTIIRFDSVQDTHIIQEGKQGHYSQCNKGVNHHLWYLSPEMVVFGVFDDSLPTSDRGAMANKLFLTKSEEMPSMTEGHFCEGSGKPKFPSISISDLVSADSRFTMKLLDLDMTFFKCECWQLVHTWCIHKSSPKA